MTSVDVLLPVRNGAPYLRDAIESILAQSFKDFRLLIIDDGSTDETPAIAAAFADHDPRIVLVTSNGTGLIDALNLGIARSTSPLIARMDADDLALPNRFERQIGYLQTHPNVDVVGSWVQPIDLNNQDLGSETRYPTGPDEIRSCLFSGQNPIANPSILMRRTAIEKVGGYRKPMQTAEDFDLWLRVADIGDLANLPEVLLRYRVHPNQVSAAQRLTQSFAAEFAFISSEERRRGNVDPAEQARGSEIWRESLHPGDPPALVALYSRFAVMREVFQGVSCHSDLLRSTLVQIANVRQSMSINHRLYADVSVKIVGMALRKGAFLIAARAIYVGIRKNMGRFIKMSFRHFIGGSKQLLN